MQNMISMSPLDESLAAGTGSDGVQAKDDKQAESHAASNDSAATYSAKKKEEVQEKDEKRLEQEAKETNPVVREAERTALPQASTPSTAASAALMSHESPYETPKKDARPEDSITSMKSPSPPGIASAVLLTASGGKHSAVCLLLAGVAGQQARRSHTSCTKLCAGWSRIAEQGTHGGRH